MTNSNRLRGHSTQMLVALVMVVSLMSNPIYMQTTAQSKKGKTQPKKANAASSINCDDEEATLTRDGQVMFPSGTDFSDPPVYEDVNEQTGRVDDLYASLEDGTDNWYSDLPCEVSIGGTEPSPGEINSAIGTVPAQLESLLGQWSSHINANQIQLKLPSRLNKATRLANPYVRPQVPHKPKPEGMILGGRDLVFIHGLKLDHLTDEWSQLQGAQKQWDGVGDPSKPGYVDNPEFYNHGNYPGYYYKKALETWETHLSKYNIKNRYLIVAYPNNARLEIGAQVILKQIADAMQFGTGVVDPTGIYGTAKFGTPSYVMITHSTGGLASNVALTSAKVHKNLGVGFVADYCKARIASQSAFSGSNYATIAVSYAYGLPLANVASFVGDVMGAFGLPNNVPPNVVKRSVLVDLIPLISQGRWGPYSSKVPVPTLTLSAGHPTFGGEVGPIMGPLSTPLKWIVHRGLDDGVVTINSQVGNPKAFIFNPSGYRPKLPRAKVFDMGLWKMGQGARSLGFFIDQVIDPALNPIRTGIVAGGPTPYVSPSGMLQPVQDGLTSNSPETLLRFPNHYSFLLSTADHYTGTHDKQKTLTSEFNSGNYLSSGGHVNNEETRVITDPRVYNLYTPPSGYPNDDQPLLRAANVPEMIEIVRGRRVRFKIKIGPIKKEKTWWIWKRTYHLLDGYEGKTQFDYAYGSVLKN